MRLSRPFEVITPTVDGDILAVLGSAAGPFSGRQIHRLVNDHSEAGIRKALDRLVKQGIVLRERVGNTYLHSLNRDHLAADAICAISQLREAAFALMSETLRSFSQPPLLAAVFGSTARREERPDSDLDLLLVPPPGADEEVWQQEVSSFTGKISRATGNDVRVLELSRSELWVASNDALRNELVREAIILLGSREVLTRRPK